jgi:hypothetical protein
VHIVKVIAGQSSLTDAARATLGDQGTAISSVGEAVSETNAQTKGIEILAAESIAGNVGKTTMTVLTGPDRLTVEFASTAAIATGEVLQGNLSPDRLIAAPLAAAIRAAQKQYYDTARPIPDKVKALLKGAYPADVLANGRYTVGSVSLSVADVTNTVRKFEGVDNAVTVGNVTVFVVEPGDNFHWWAHELQHQVQYAQWGIDEFAFKYVTSCHDVETGAENEAQHVVPTNGSVSLGC